MNFRRYIRFLLVAMALMMGILPAMGISNGLEFLEARSFISKKIRTKELVANVTMRIHNKPEILIKMSGDETVLRSTRVEAWGKELVIVQAQSLRSTRDPIDLYIYMPSDTKLDIDANYRGRWYIEGVYAPVKLDLEGNIEMRIGHLAGPLEVKGLDGAFLNINKFFGSFDCLLSQGSRVVINSGTASKWTAEIKEMGEIQFLGKATDPKINIDGEGEVRISSVQGNGVVKVQGNGLVQIGSGQLTDLKANIQNAGDIRYLGSAINADLSIFGTGLIEVNAVYGKLKERSGLGKETGTIRIHKRGMQNAL